MKAFGTKNPSASRLTDWIRCERYTALQALTGVWKDSPATLLGRRVHRALEHVGKQLLSQMELGATIERVAQEIPSCASYVRRARPVFEHLTPTVVEKRFSELDKTKFGGVIDLVSSSSPKFGADRALLPEGEEIPCILDWKTTGNPARAAVTMDSIRHNLQLQVYSLYTGISRAGLVFFYPDADAPVRGALVDFTPRDLARARNWLRMTIRASRIRFEAAEKRVLTQFEDELEIVEGYDLSGFSLARPDDPLCSAKWCPYFGECIGRKDQERNGTET